ncbi:MAG: sodium/solute symporter [Planctomycetes bacterium]|nr:sodium/solute symporter [Planctomycetota bacterium]
MGTIDFIVMILFVVCVIGVGLIKSKGGGGESSDGEESTTDYFLAGRGLSWWLIGFSLIAANISAEQFVGMSGQGAGLEGLSVSSWEWIAAITLVVVAFVLLPYFLKTGITTIPEFLEVRYNHWARLVMTLSMTAILIAASLVGVIYAGALTMTELMRDMGTELSMVGCCWALGSMAAIYVAVGGLKACAWADLIQGSALIVGGGLITYFAFESLGNADVSTLIGSTGASADMDQGAGALEKFSALNDSAMKMDSPAMPWPVLLLGIWIPNFYYWGLNQYITQRILGSASLADGQKGLVLAGALKLIIPFIIVIPGIIAFNLFSGDMEERANEAAEGKNVFFAFEREVANPQSNVLFELDPKYAKANPEKAAEIEKHNSIVKTRIEGELPESEMIKPYKYDSAMGLLITKLIPKEVGLLGFVIAALLGAIVSSLAAVLNAASTLFTMDVYQRYMRPKAKQKEFVTVGRICIGVFVLIGCIAAPMIQSPSIFGYIQWLQGFVSTGILAVFVYGLINRSSGQWGGVIGIVANAIIYGGLALFFPDIHFLYGMSYCFLAVLAILIVYGIIDKADQAVEFESVTTMDMTTSIAARNWGIVVCILTVALYIVFW